MPETAHPAIPDVPAATPRPKAAPKGAASDPAQDLAPAQRKVIAPDAVAIPAAMPTGAAAPPPVAAPVAQAATPGNDAAPLEAAIRPAAPAPVSGHGGPDGTPQAQHSAGSAAPPAAIPAPGLPDSPAAPGPAPVPLAEPVQQAGTLSAVPAAPVAMMDRADWPQTVVTATLAGLSPDGGTMTMEISPQELGALRITLTLEGDSASVRIETATPEAARLLNEAERQLSQDFARQGVTLAAHDAQNGRRGDSGAHTPDLPTPAGGEDPSSNPVALLRPLGIINLIA